MRLAVYLGLLSQHHDRDVITRPIVADTYQVAALTKALLPGLRTIPNPCRQNESFETRYRKSRVPARLFHAYMAHELGRVCRRPRPCRLNRRKRCVYSGPAFRLEGNLDR